MFFCDSFSHVKKVSLFAFLLTQPLVMHAQSPESATSGAGAAEEKSGSEQQRTFYFPRWPQPQPRERMERIPPPPPGPYMSSALAGSRIKPPSFSQDNKPAMKVESSSVSMDTFNPDIPWPSSNIASSPGRWKPERGYNYVNPQADKQQYNTAPNYNYGNRYPSMNWPASSSNTMPFMRPSIGMDSGRPNYSRPASNQPDNPLMQYRQPAY